MNEYDYAYKFSDELEIWGNLDSCEGGDLLRSLAGAISTSHYTYTGDEKEILHDLVWVALGELYWHLDSEIVWEYQDQGYREACFLAIKNIWKEN